MPIKHTGRPMGTCRMGERGWTGEPVGARPIKAYVGFATKRDNESKFTYIKL